MISTRKDKKYKSPLWNIQWDRVIYDEAHHMRNPKSKAFNGARKLKVELIGLLLEPLFKIMNGFKRFINDIRITKMHCKSS